MRDKALRPQITYTEARGNEATRYLQELAELRMNVFRDFPYLYEGDLAYERKYLETYFSSPNSFVVFARDEDQGGKIVGASTAILLSDAEEAFRQPFEKNAIDKGQVCYFGESVLLKDYRGLGIGKAFMNARLRFAQEMGMKYASFCAVVRPNEHPLRPTHYKPLDEFWKQMGFQLAPQMMTEYDWKDIDQPSSSKKKMQFWIRELSKETLVEN